MGLARSVLVLAVGVLSRQEGSPDCAATVQAELELGSLNISIVGRLAVSTSLSTSRWQGWASIFHDSALSITTLSSVTLALG